EPSAVHLEQRGKACPVGVAQMHRSIGAERPDAGELAIQGVLVGDGIRERVAVRGRGARSDPLVVTDQMTRVVAAAADELPVARGPIDVLGGHGPGIFLGRFPRLLIPGRTGSIASALRLVMLIPTEMTGHPNGIRPAPEYFIQLHVTARGTVVIGTVE